MTMHMQPMLTAWSPRATHVTVTVTHAPHRSIHKNLLTSIPSELGALRVCSRLSLYENELTELPPEIGAMEGMQEL